MTQFGWFGTFATLAQFDVLKLELVNNIPLYTAFAFLAYEHERAEFTERLGNVKQ